MKAQAPDAAPRRPKVSEERFELMEKLGAGGMGAVWKARDNAAGGVVAIKFMHPLVAGDPDHIRHFQNEVDSGRRIDSPHVVRSWSWSSSRENRLRRS
jgi:serine/threonine-protein kinase